MRRSKHHFKTPQYRTCFKCERPITNPFRSKPLCDDCSIELQQLSFNGEEVLEMFIHVLPPANLRAVLVAQLYQASRQVLVEKGILLPDEDDESEGDEGTKPAILLGV